MGTLVIHVVSDIKRRVNEVSNTGEGEIDGGDEDKRDLRNISVV